MTVPTVDLGFLDVVFCSIDIAGDNPSILSRSGFCIISRNCLAYAESDSTYLLCPSAYIVSKASDDFPDPDSPVMTMSECLGRSIFIFLRLCSLAPLTLITFLVWLIFVVNPVSVCNVFLVESFSCEHNTNMVRDKMLHA